MQTEFILTLRDKGFISSILKGIITTCPRLLLLFFLLYSFKISAQHQHLSNHQEEKFRYSKEKAEQLWEIADEAAFWKSFSAKYGMSPEDAALFQYYIRDRWFLDQAKFITAVRRGTINETNLHTFFEDLEAKYNIQYTQFLPLRDKLKKELKEAFETLAANGPCDNIDFEKGTFDGWTGSYQDRNTTPGQSNNPTPGQLFNTFGQHCIMTPSMKDPNIPALPVVAPGGNYSVRLGNTIAGGHIARMRQTFRVDSSNMIFSYSYAVVLEDPQGQSANNHTGLNRPYFQAKLYDSKGKEITCANYTVVVTSNLQSYKRICVDGNDDESIDNIGCPPDDATIADTSSPVFGSCGNALDVYYKPWTSVSILLNDYLNQNVTIEFTAADCTPNGHLGYAYVDAKCAPLSMPRPPSLCSGKETKKLKAPDGFRLYNWSGPGITSAANLQEITIDRAGRYRVIITPFSDAPCPDTLFYVARDSCPPRNYKDTICETGANTGIAEKTNLSSYNNLVTENGSWGTVQSWHTGKPASTANRIINPASVNISEATTYYAVSRTAIRTDTVPLNFFLNKLPLITFPDIPPFCQGNPETQITGVTPAGGTFSGKNVTAAGRFNPVDSGKSAVKYLIKTPEGCKDSLVKNAVVYGRAIIEAGKDQQLCANAKTVTLSAEQSKTRTLTWSGGSGKFTGSGNAVTTYSPSDADLKAGTITIRLVATATAPCPDVRDSLRITFQPLPSADAGHDQILCESSSVATLEGKTEYSEGGRWSSQTGSFASDTILNTNYKPAATVRDKPIPLILTTRGNGLCPPDADTVLVTFVSLPQIEAGEDQTICENIKSVNLKASGTNYKSLSWTGRNGKVTSADQLEATYQTVTEDITSENIYLTVTAQGNTPCPAVKDSMKITINLMPQATPGDDQKICASEGKAQLSGKAVNASKIRWSAQRGTFGSDTSLTTTFTPAASDLDKTISIKLTAFPDGVCPVDTQLLRITFVPVASSDAGKDQKLCENTPSVLLSGKSTATSQVTWSGGAGKFNNADALTTEYLPASAEKTTGSVILYLTATPQLPCLPVVDTVKVLFDHLPESDAGPDQILCENTEKVTLEGKIKNAAGAEWSSAGGTFQISDALNSVFTPANRSGKIPIILTTTGNGVCPADADTLVVTYIPFPDVDAGNNLTVCENKKDILLTGTAADVKSLSWRGGTGEIKNAQTLTPSYTPSSADISKGEIILTLTGEGNTPCPQVKDSLKMIFHLLPEADAGQDQLICTSVSSVNLKGTIKNSASSRWSGGKGQISDAADLVTTYIPSAEDKSTGSITLQLKSIAGSVCPDDSETVVIRFKPVHEVVLPDDKNVCADNPATQITAVIRNTNGGKWKGGTGSFTPHDSALAVVYNPGISEIQNGKAALTFTTAPDTVCNSVTDDITIIITQPPSANAGSDQKVCANDSLVQLNGNSANSDKFFWINGKGKFTPSTSELKPVYEPAASEIRTQKTQLILVAEGRGACNPARDTMNIEIIPAPSAEAGPEKFVCEKTPLTDIIATVKNADSTIWTSGNGIFAPDKNSLKINYTLSSDEIRNGYAKLILKSMKTLCKPAYDTVFVRSVRHPELLSTDVESCIGNKVTISTTAQQNVTYQWKNSSGDIVASTYQTEVIVTQDTTEYFVNATNQTNCSSADSLIVTGIPYAELQLSDVDFCPGESEKMNITVKNTDKLQKYPFIYNWKNEHSILSATTSQITVTEPGTYTGIIKVKDLCESSASAKAQLRPLPVSPLKDLYKFCSESEQNVVLDAGEGSHYEWEQDADTVRIKNTTTSGHYSVIITNTYGCKKRFETVVKEVCPPRLYVSKAFSPNNDGSNDLYDVFGAHIGAFQLLIFNRWGEIIYETNDRFKFWDGMYRGEPMPVGVYPWIITYEGDSEEFKGPYKQEGSVTVIR